MGTIQPSARVAACLRAGEISSVELVQDALDGMDAHVASTFERAKSRLAAAGAQIVEIAFAELEELPEINAKGGFSAAEAWAWHKDLIATRGNLYDPRVLTRILRGKDISAEDLETLRQHHASLISRARQVTAGFDALVMPTVPIVAPEIAPLAASDDTYHRTNLLVLRNTVVANFLDRCALSLPCSEAGKPPVGLMLMGEHGTDRRLLGIGLSVESVLSQIVN